MAVTEDVVPAFVRVKHSVRVITAVPSDSEKGLNFVVKVILEEIGRVSRREILAIQDYPRRGVFDVTFDGEGVYRSFLEILERNSADPRLKDFKILPHFAEEEIFLVVKPYSPFVPLREIETVLGRYCKKLTCAGKILNELGIWTCKYRFKAVFEKGTFPPARFRLGAVNIDCFFNGMPDFCKRCRQYGHMAEGCMLCQNCGKAGHEVKNCSLPKKCNFCLQVGHLYAVCPQRKVKDEVLGKSVAVVEPAAMSSGVEASEEMESESGKVLTFLTDFDLSASPVLQFTDESLSESSSPASEVSPMVKRKKKEKNKDIQVTPSNVEVYKTRGEKLYQFWKKRSDKEIQEYLGTWTNEEELEGINRCIETGTDEKNMRYQVLTFIRNLT
ncbi:zinc finger CCHC domain-containing protein 3-like [Xenopus tropicalis]|uniref:Zinc finger CCHC domain-containing protein 3-like n=1 Tax=Xenopus tropicalis TaxID=8364 RepID=A0A8J0SDK0_XENTR|nr:zinc finger CCHC domain-containing protein 3-like [Xenopus tropicalis]|eukprot:XP_012810417.1 PREDICTED: zinc finger CCHC domain-containing protein 3-like [Xenopus tropicalis]